MKTYYNEFLKVNRDGRELQYDSITAIEPYIKAQLAKGYSIGEIQNLLYEEIHSFAIDYRLTFCYDEQDKLTAPI